MDMLAPPRIYHLELCKSINHLLAQTVKSKQRLRKDLWGFPGGSAGKESTCNWGRPGFDPWAGNIPWRREWLPTPVLSPGAFQGQRSLVGYSPWGHRESDMAEWLSLSLSRKDLRAFQWQNLWALGPSFWIFLGVVALRVSLPLLGYV